ncbi:hypothetical protein HK098_002357 [Nowakowskiella sp. JEL0407]|nr:hypothetical protein HK098_002357 [Nowakowskiella sp. JEL0407]
MEEEFPFSDAQLDTAIEIFSHLNKNPTLQSLAKENQKLATLIQSARQLLFPTKEELKQRRAEKREQKKNEDYKVLDVIGIRQSRNVKLVAYNGGSVEVNMPPRVAGVEINEEFSKQDDLRIEYSQPSENFQQSSSFTTPPEENSSQPQNFVTPNDAPPKILNFKRNCHICAASFKQLHHFYDQLCPNCASFNFAKRSSSANFTGRVCLVTGARVKIGYCIALKLLRQNARVIVTTRFPHDAAHRYAQEPDFLTFKNRLFIYGIDFRELTMVREFCKVVKSKFERLDVIINNAAQTVRKPTMFYSHLMKRECEVVEEWISDVAEVVDVFKIDGKYVFSDLKRIESGVTRSTSILPSSSSSSTTSNSGVDSGSAVVSQSNQGKFMPVSSQLSQLELLPEDSTSSSLFPQNQYDRDDQQVDLRSINSWTLEIGQIDPLEMVECHVINAFAPYILVSELTSLMEATRGLGGVEVCDKYIVNVSAMEGQFYRPMKSIHHPHTNMAKAALNMMTRTSALGLAEKNIFMTAVDTGWITDEKPVEEWHKRGNAPPPLDEWDAAMRVLDPVITGMNGEKKLWGVFLKNYTPTRW